MSAPSHRYRITVTPIESDGLQCLGRCTIEFEQHSPEDWMRILEGIQRQRGLSGDERAALTVGAELLGGLIHTHPPADDDLFAELRPHMARFLARLGGAQAN